MTLREFFLENFAGDLEYHPRRAFAYLTLAVGAASFWVFSRPESKFTAVPLVFLLGGIALVGKAVFLLRPSSEGLGLSQQEIDDLTNPQNRKQLPELPAQAAQILQDFGIGGLLLWPLLGMGQDIDHSWVNPPRLKVFLYGAVIFGFGWIVRRMTATAKA